MGCRESIESYSGSPYAALLGPTTSLTRGWRSRAVFFWSLPQAESHLIASNGSRIAAVPDVENDLSEFGNLNVGCLPIWHQTWSLYVGRDVGTGDVGTRDVGNR
jgi:hypothetical protein